MYLSKQKGKLKDGYKIVILSASFIPNDGNEGDELKDTLSKAKISLSYNGIRCAHDRSPLGYVHPRFLSRGLSIRSFRLGQFVPSLLNNRF